MTEYSMEEYRKMKSDYAKLNDKHEKLQRELATTKVVYIYYLCLTRCKCSIHICIQLQVTVLNKSLACYCQS